MFPLVWNRSEARQGYRVVVGDDGGPVGIGSDVGAWCSETMHFEAGEGLPGEA